MDRDVLLSYPGMHKRTASDELTCGHRACLIQILSVIHTVAPYYSAPRCASLKDSSHWTTVAATWRVTCVCHCTRGDATTALQVPPRQVRAEVVDFRYQLENASYARVAEAAHVGLGHCDFLHRECGRIPVVQPLSWVMVRSEKVATESLQPVALRSLYIAGYKGRLVDRRCGAAGAGCCE